MSLTRVQVLHLTREAADTAVVRRLGDVFGPTVSIASRLTSLSRPGRGARRPVDAGVLVEGDPDEAEFRLRKVRRTSVMGYHRLEPWRLKRPEPG